MTDVQDPVRIDAKTGKLLLEAADIATLAGGLCLGLIQLPMFGREGSTRYCAVGAIAKASGFTDDEMYREPAEAYDLPAVDTFGRWLRQANVPIVEYADDSQSAVYVTNDVLVSDGRGAEMIEYMRQAGASAFDEE